MKDARTRTAFAGGSLAAGAVAGLLAASTGAAATAPTQPAGSSHSALSSCPAHHPRRPVHTEVFAPERHDNVGIEGKGWFVDMELSFPGGPDGLHRTGFTALQLTGPGVHHDVAPLPGTFSTGRDDRNPGLVVLTSTTNSTTPGFVGPGTNLANLFDITGVTNRSVQETELWDTWLVGAAVAGKGVNTTLTVTEVADRNRRPESQRRLRRRPGCGRRPRSQRPDRRAGPRPAGHGRQHRHRALPPHRRRVVEPVSGARWGRRPGQEWGVTWASRPVRNSRSTWLSVSASASSYQRPASASRPRRRRKSARAAAR